MRSPNVVRLAIAGGLLVGASSFERPARGTATLAARPLVALQLGIDTGHYRNRLGDSTLRALEAVLVDSVRALLQKEYRHINWTPSGSAAMDTVELRVANKPPRELSQSELRFRIRGPELRMLKDSVTVEFERYPIISNRIDWKVDSLRRQWLAMLPALIKKPDLLTDVFGRVPFIAEVRFTPPDLAITVPVSRDELGHPGEVPVFTIRGKIRDPGTNSNEWAELRLQQCKTALTSPGFTCQISRIDYPGDPIEDTARLRAIVARATLDSTRILVTAFEGLGNTGTLDLPIPPRNP